jgi:hypothetical protein
MTQAERVAERFGNDGQNWVDARGRHLDEVCDKMAAPRWGDVFRYEFADGSAIVVDNEERWYVA